MGDWEVVGEEGHGYQLVPCSLLVSQSLTVLPGAAAPQGNGCGVGWGAPGRLNPRPRIFLAGIPVLKSDIGAEQLVASRRTMWAQIGSISVVSSVN